MQEIAMIKADWLEHTTPAFRLMIGTSWLAPDSWRQNQNDAIREALKDGPDWKQYLSLVDRHRTPALSWASLNRATGIGVPEFVKRELQKRSDACRMKAMQHCLLLAGVLKRFNHAAIPVMPLKGQILSLELYGDVGLRETLDIDLEVPREDLAGAQNCLVSKDWHLEETFFPMSPRQWDSFLHNEQHINFIHNQTGRMLELHWRNQWEAPDATRARWARSVPSTWQGCSIQAMNPSDMTLYLCCHGGLHEWFRAKWLGDLARAHSLGLLDWKAAWEEARRSRQTRVLLAGIYLLEQVYGLPRPDLSPEVWQEPSPKLIAVPLQALVNSDEPLHRVSPAKLLKRMGRSRYERLLWPAKSWRDSFSELFYGREDFRTLPLPDGFFWAYKPLRPALWMWQWLRQMVHSSLHRAN
jgi:Uncharacterised nucleotidyltransferase